MIAAPLSVKRGFPILISLLLLAGAACFLNLSSSADLTAILLASAAVVILVAVSLRSLVFQEESEQIFTSNASLETTWSSSSISSGNSLTKVLDQLVSRVHVFLDAESTVLHLFDASGTSIQSSFSVGAPLYDDGTRGPYRGAAVRSAKFSNRAEQELLFAGERLGMLEVKLKAGELFNAPAVHGLRALALHGVMVLVNARYTQELVKQKRGSNLELEVRTGFLGTLSHEIRGPLGIILNASELVLEGLCGQLTSDQFETLSMVKANTSHLMELISDVLDFAKLESGKMIPTPENLSVNDQLMELTKMVRAQCDNKGHILRFRESIPPVLIRSDRRHFRQMLLNLLTNAIKYTPDGGEIDVWCEPGTRNTLKVCVRDSGVGIPIAQRSKVFAPFERVDHEYSSSQEGTGLGLSLTKRLAEVNGGAVHFDSVEGVGTTFWVEVPITDKEAQVLSQSTVEASPARNSGDELLIVGPGDEERVLVTRYLRSLGYGVHIAEDAAVAQGMLRNHTIKLVLIGTGFVRAGNGPIASFVRQEQGDRYIPVLLLTRSAFLVDVERYLLEDVDRCLPKPVRLEEIALACQAALDATQR